MKKYLLLVALLTSGLLSYAQEDDELYEDPDNPQKESSFEKHLEVGADVYFSASTYGSTGGIGLKLAFLQNEYVAFGPSVRYNYSHYKNNGLTGNTSVYGGGMFIHGRFLNYLFAGADFEVLKSPFINGVVSTGSSKWVPTCLVGAGFSHAFGETQFFRLQAGVMYDVINNLNSPLRFGYFMHKENGTLIPLLYRITVFFTL